MENVPKEHKAKIAIYTEPSKYRKLERNLILVKRKPSSTMECKHIKKQNRINSYRRYERYWLIKLEG